MLKRKTVAKATKKKKTPQQLHAESEKERARALSFESIVVAIEQSKIRSSKLEKKRRRYSDKIQLELDNERVTFNQLKRYLTYKKVMLK